MRIIPSSKLVVLVLDTRKNVGKNNVFFLRNQAIKKIIEFHEPHERVDQAVSGRDITTKNSKNNVKLLKYSYKHVLYKKKNPQNSFGIPRV